MFNRENAIIACKACIFQLRADGHIDEDDAETAKLEVEDMTDAELRDELRNWADTDDKVYGAIMERYGFTREGKERP
jgi:uncharacterized membrane protein YebE (DUF533 family)